MIGFISYILIKIETRRNIMRKSKKVLSVILSLSMAFSMSLIQPNYQVKADNSYSVLDANDNGKEEDRKSVV